MKTSIDGKTKFTPNELRKFKGFEAYDDQKAQTVINGLDVLAEIILKFI